MNGRSVGMIWALAASVAAAHDSGWRNAPACRPYYGREFCTGAYAGLSIGQLRYSEEGLATITPATAMLFIGAPLSPNLAIEGRFGGGLGSAQTDGYGVEVRSLYAGYLKGMMPLSPGFSLYALGGLAGVDLQRDFGLVEAHDTGFSYGLGVDFELVSNARLSIEWTRLATGNNLGYDYDVDQASISLAWRF